MRRILIAGALSALIVGCEHGAGLTDEQVKTCIANPAGSICVTGTVSYYSLEGGFWAVRGDDSVTYDPMGGVPEALQQDGLRVLLIAKPRPDMVGFHMVGPIVEIISITKIQTP